MRAAAAVSQALRHRDPDRVVLSGDGVASRIPDDGVVPVTLAEELAERVGVLLVEDLLGSLVDVPRLGRDQAHDQAQLVRPVDDVIDVLEEGLVGPRGVAIDERGLSEE